MRGIIFVELLDHLDAIVGEDVVEETIAGCDLPSGGAYTAVEDYPDQELIILARAFADRAGVPLPDFLEDAGVALFGALAGRYPELTTGVEDPFAFLEAVGSHIHRHVVRLYPGAVPPALRARRVEGRLELEYESRRAMWRLARGLVRGCVAHFGREVRIETLVLRSDGTHVQFHLEYVD